MTTKSSAKDLNQLPLAGYEKPSVFIDYILQVNVKAANLAAGYIKKNKTQITLLKAQDVNKMITHY